MSSADLDAVHAREQRLQLRHYDEERGRYTRSRTVALSGYHDEQRLCRELQGRELQNLNGSLRNLFKQDKTPIPKADEVLSIPQL